MSWPLAGRAMWKPWARSQPRRRSSASWSADSTPSATARSPRVWARVMMAVTMAESLESSPEAVDEGLVDLQDVDREAPEVAAATSSRCRSRRRRGCTPRRVQPAERVGRHLDVVHQHALGDLELDQRRVDAGVGEHGGHVVDEAGVAELAAREVDRDRQRRRCARPTACQRCTCRQAWSSTHAPIGTMSPVSSATVMKSPGQQQAPLGVLPAQQRLDAVDPPGAQVDHRLVERRGARGGRGPGAARSRCRAGRRRWPAWRCRTAPSATRPRSLARYMAASASRISVSGSASVSSGRAMPMLTPTNTSVSSMTNGPLTASSTRSAMAMASCWRDEVLAEDDELVAAEAGHGVAGAERHRPGARRWRRAAGRRARGRGCR